MHEGDLIWSRFKIYLSLNIGAIAVIAFFLKEFIDKLHQSPPWLWLVILGVSIIGRYLSITWESVNADGGRWQLHIDERIANLEKRMNEEGVTLYSDILSEYYSTKEKQIDVTDTNVRLANFFASLWLILSLLSLVVFFVTGSVFIYEFKQNFCI